MEAVFLRSVLEIVSLRAEEQMIRIDAERVVAARAVVADVQPSRDRTTQELPGQSMRLNVPLEPVDARKDELAVTNTRPSRASGPQPARVGLVDARPEPCCNTCPHVGRKIAPRPLSLIPIPLVNSPSIMRPSGNH